MSWSDPWVPGAVTGSLALVAAVLTGILTSVLSARRDRNNANRDANRATPPSTQQVWDRLDKVEKALGAGLILLGESVEQHNNPGTLKFNKSAIRTLRETGYMPAELEDVLNDQG